MAGPQCAWRVAVTGLAVLERVALFLPGYDPDREGSTEQALAYLARSPGVLPATIRVAA